MNIVKSARTWLELSQPQFAEYLSRQTGMSIRFQNVSAWERGKRAIPAKVRNVCLYYAMSLAFSVCTDFHVDQDRIEAMCERLKG